MCGQSARDPQSTEEGERETFEVVGEGCAALGDPGMLSARRWPEQDKALGLSRGQQALLSSGLWASKGKGV